MLQVQVFRQKEVKSAKADQKHLNISMHKPMVDRQKRVVNNFFLFTTRFSEDFAGKNEGVEKISWCS